MQTLVYIPDPSIFVDLLIVLVDSVTYHDLSVIPHLMPETNGPISLIYNEKTAEATSRLMIELGTLGYTNVRSENMVDEKKPRTIFDTIQRACQYHNPTAEKIGLLYTGASKLMLLQAYQALEHWYSKIIYRYPKELLLAHYDVISSSLVIDQNGETFYDDQLLIPINAIFIDPILKSEAQLKTCEELHFYMFKNTHVIVYTENLNSGSSKIQVLVNDLNLDKVTLHIVPHLKDAENLKEILYSLGCRDIQIRRSSI